MRKGSVIILVEGQIIKTKWSNTNKKWFINKGYVFTKIKDDILVKAEDLMPSTKIKVKVKCDYCGDVFNMEYGKYIHNLSQNIQKIACRNCWGRKISESRQKIKEEKYCEFLNICEINGYKPLSNEFVDGKTPLAFKCERHGVQNMLLYKLRDTGCPSCFKEQRSKSYAKECYDLFLSLCKEANYIPVSTLNECKNKDSKMDYICPKHGKQTIRIRHMEHGSRCGKCRYDYNSSVLKIDKNELIHIIESKNNNKLLNPDDYVVATTNNLMVKCGNCGNVFTVSLNNYKKNTDGKCPCCSSKSKGEDDIAEVLSMHNISYVRQRRFSDCRDKRTLPFDFYLSDHNMCIEFDGPQHYKAIFGEDKFKITKKHDGIKNQYCAKNNIKLVRIPYWEGNNIEEILNKHIIFNEI